MQEQPGQASASGDPDASSERASGGGGDGASSAARLPSRNASSKYDFVKVKVWLGENADHSYVLSRFLSSRMLTVTKIPNHVAIKIALELKKLLVDNSLLDVSQSDLEANLFKGIHLDPSIYLMDEENADDNSRIEKKASESENGEKKTENQSQDGLPENSKRVIKEDCTQSQEIVSEEGRTNEGLSGADSHEVNSSAAISQKDVAISQKEISGHAISNFFLIDAISNFCQHKKETLTVTRIIFLMLHAYLAST